MIRRLARRALVSSAVVVTAMAVVSPANALPRVGPTTVGSNGAKHAPVTDITCPDPPHVVCGYVTVPLDRQDPSLGKLHIYFQRYLHSDTTDPALEPIVAVEGGPGYSTTGSRWSYRTLFHPMMDRHDLLLVDLRGTGGSDPINCRRLQRYVGSYDKDVGLCGKQLGPASDLYGTHQAADDMAAVLRALDIPKIDLYGDSYGTFFSQTFAVRFPQLVRAVVLDSAYFVQWPDPWYSDTNTAMVNAFRLACARWPACPTPDGMTPILRLLDAVRQHPISGRAPGGDGRWHNVSVDAGGVGKLMADAATNPDLYRELDAAALAAIAPDHDTLPLLRLMAENNFYGGGGPVREWSEGLYDAVSCNDYPQAYNMSDPFPKRKLEYRASIKGLESKAPNIFWPFTVKEWVTYPEHYWDSCLQWPIPNRIDPPVPPNAHYPDMPVLVLSGDEDSLTSPEGALATAEAFPNSTFVPVANMGHVSALADYGHCASNIVIRFFETLSAGDTSCAAQYQPNRLVNQFVEHASDLGIADPRQRTAVVAADTVADVAGRWYESLATKGFGLRGGTFKMTGYTDVVARLDGVEWVDDVAVSGKLTWNHRNGDIAATVTVSGPGATPGTLRMSWNDWQERPMATVTGHLGGQQVSYSFLAP